LIRFYKARADEFQKGYGLRLISHPASQEPAFRASK
jgi:hypothetical protein